MLVAVRIIKSKKNKIMIIGKATCKWCGYITTTGGIGKHNKHCLKNPDNIKRNKMHPIEIPNSELPKHLQELIDARDLAKAIELMDKSVHCLFLELPSSVAEHHKSIWQNIKNIIKEDTPNPTIKEGKPCPTCGRKVSFLDIKH